MSVELVVALSSALVALSTAGMSAWWARRQSLLAAELDQQSAERLRQANRLDAMSRYRDPLLWSAFDLQTRIYNLAGGASPTGIRFLAQFHEGGSPRQRRYSLYSTLHRVAEYMGWVEIMRTHIQFLDLGTHEDNRVIMNHIFTISSVFTSGDYEDEHLRIFRSDQRALGELMIRREGDAVDCIGYAEFCARMEQDDTFQAWFEELSQSLQELAGHDGPLPRLLDLRDALLALINHLDPKHERFPARFKSSLPPDVQARADSRSGTGDS
ncbi:hypothetical protein [Streptomyces sp. NBC_00887]|uniref:hypothetical protein n=1 Tax=Streptomyces sp. NBC_00887 TaxID=2975859 RepID=UPI00386F692E|nr:hypothetical protein OG844_03275 [Streptomyces sp. NBC_00887]WSY35871.1 hypothetical protein OG844_42325 [Streptomyces sp. NBC_00887]